MSVHTDAYSVNLKIRISREDQYSVGDSYFFTKIFWSAKLKQFACAFGDQFSGNADCDLRRCLCADGQTDRGLAAVDLCLGKSICQKLFAERLALPAASHDADVGDGGLHHLFLDDVVAEMSARHNAGIVFRVKIDQFR